MREDRASRFDIGLNSGRCEGIFSGAIPAPGADEAFREYLADWPFYKYLDSFITLFYVLNRPKDFSWMAVFRSHQFDRRAAAVELHWDISTLHQRLAGLQKRANRWLNKTKIEDVINVFIELWYRMGSPEELVWLAVFVAQDHNVKQACLELICITRQGLYKKLERLEEQIARSFFPTANHGGNQT